MSYIIPTDLYLSVVRAAATMSLHADGGQPTSSESFSLILRAARDTYIVLSSGQRLSEVDIHLTLSTKWHTAPELDRDLTMDDVGFLSHAEGERGRPFVHGGALLTDTAVVATLFSPGAAGKVKIVLPTVPFSDNRDAPYIWRLNRPNMLRISHIEVSVIRGDSEQTDD